MKIGSCLLTTIGAFALTIAPVAAAPLWLVIGDGVFGPTIERLAEHRRKQGFEVMMRDGPVEAALASVPHPPRYIVLLGDDLVGEGKMPERALKAERHTLYRWRATQAETFASDSMIGDFDKDGIPEVPVGRIPATSEGQLDVVISKILAFERQPLSVADLSIPVWAGNPNYGDAFQANMASNLLRQTLQSEAPSWADLWLLMGSAADPLAGVPNLQGEWFNDRLTKGGAIVGMMGHGGTDAFYSMVHEGAWVTYNTRSLSTGSILPAPPAVLFTCDCGNFAHDKASLGEAMLYSPRGPVAAIGATTESHPLPNYYSSVSLLRSLGKGVDRIGDLWIETQRDGFQMRNALVEMFLRDIEGKLDAKLDTPRIRQDHLKLYALLGDPATALRLPKQLDMTWKETDDGFAWHVPRKSGVRRLEIGYRSPIPSLKPRSGVVGKVEAKRLFDEANQSLVFRPKESLTADADWSGSLAEPGSYRFIVHGDHDMACAAQVLKPE